MYLLSLCLSSLRLSSIRLSSMKQHILNRYKQLIQDRIDAFQDMILGLTVDAQNDAKGSAGDKHETALAMMHLEQEKLNFKLKELLEQKAVLDKIDANSQHKVVALGSVVKTNQLWLFVSSALPKITIDDKTIFALSTNSPLACQMMGNRVGHTFELNGKKYTIEEIQ
jgi:transcription elongation GreA/GreB family factor